MLCYFIHLYISFHYTTKLYPLHLYIHQMVDLQIVLLTYFMHCYR